MRDRKCSECIHFQVCQFRMRLQREIPDSIMNIGSLAVICKVYKYKGDDE